MCLDSMNMKVALPFLIDDIDDFSVEVSKEMYDIEFRSIVILVCSCFVY